MFTDDLTRYAELAVSSVSLLPGQSLLIRSEPVHWPLVNRIARIAYSRGARYVRVESDHAELYKARIECSGSDYLGFQPKYLQAQYQEMIDDGWALISIKNPDDPDTLAGLDPQRSLAARKPLQEIQHPWRRQLHADRFPWLVLAAPTAAWAAKVLGVSADQGAREELWNRMKPILRLDQSDPHAAWVQNGERLAARALTLDGLSIRELHFAGPGTDLAVRLNDRARWKGGHSHTPDGRVFFPNLPTEEVFTTPDCTRTSGTVTVTRPVLVMDQSVEGASFRFEAGRVVEFAAKRGEAALASFVDSDAGARSMGEIALVDVDSPVYRSNTVFHNILFDENAACHFALGSAYPGCIAGYDSLSPDDRARVGINESTEHTDFMIGSEQLTVTARCGDSCEPTVIMKNGRFSLPGATE